MFDWRELASGGLDVLGLALVLAGFSWAWARKVTRIGLVKALGLGMICAGLGLGSPETWRQVLWFLLGAACFRLAVVEERKSRR